MILVLFAALQVAAAAPPEWVWADIYIDDTRGGADRIEILPKVEIEGARRVLRSVSARRTRTFMGKTMQIRWTDTQTCPRLRGALDAIVEVRPLANSNLAQSYEGPSPPPPPPNHRPVAQVKVAGLTMTALAESPLGGWVQGVYEATADCWRADR